MIEEEEKDVVFTESEIAFEALIEVIYNFEKIIWWTMVVEEEQDYSYKRGQPLKKEDEVNTNYVYRSMVALNIQRHKNTLYFNCPIAEDIQVFMEQHPDFAKLDKPELRL